MVLDGFWGEGLLIRAFVWMMKMEEEFPRSLGGGD